ncbi:uncharacterized protein PG986_014534 [Apiospora aurea]|uniref:Uncharacterized protein n=1 Tax=Apiospora aurea TaxID=335848 RepID=A0ABR1PT93_9PEZI
MTNPPPSPETKQPTPSSAPPGRRPQQRRTRRPAAITKLPALPTLTAPDCEIVAGPPLTFAIGPSTFQRGATLAGSFSHTQTCVLESTTAATCSYSSSIAPDCKKAYPSSY